MGTYLSVSLHLSLDMKIKIMGAGKTVSGSCYSISVNNEKILVDCGMFQGGKDIEKLNFQDFNFDPKEYKALILTHAHLDHCGRIPKLVKQGFRGKIYSTDATKELAQIIMLDSAHIAKMDTDNENLRREQEGLPARKPIYAESDVNLALRLFSVIPYRKEIKLSSYISFTLYNAGHIMGACSIQLKINDAGKNKILTFSGDLGQRESIIIKNTDPINESDFVFIESTYGDRLHPEISLREKEFIRIINQTYKKMENFLYPHSRLKGHKIYFSTLENS